MLDLIKLIDVDMNIVWIVLGCIVFLFVALYLIKGFLFMGVYGMFVYPYYWLKNKHYGNVRKEGQIRLGASSDTLNRIMRENKKDFGGLFFELKNNGKVLNRTVNFAYDFLNRKYIDYSVKDQELSMVNYSFLMNGRSKEAILTDSFDELETERILTGKKPTKLFKKMIVDSAFNTVDGYTNNTVYKDNVLFYVLGRTLYVVSRSLVPHYIYADKIDEKIINYKTCQEDLRGHNEGVFFNPYVYFKKENIVAYVNLLKKEYESLYSKELVVKNVVWFVNSSKKMNKVASKYPEIETIYGVKGLINLLLNAKVNTRKDETPHAQDFVDFLYLKYFNEDIYEGGKKGYKTVVLNNKRKCYHVDNDGYSEKVGYYGSCYSQCIDCTLDFIFMRYYKKAKTSYLPSDVYEGRKLYFSKR